MRRRRIILLVVVALVLCAVILVVCFADIVSLTGKRMVVKTIDDKCLGVGEAIEANITIIGIWIDNPENPNEAHFIGFVDPTMPAWDAFRWMTRGVEGRSLNLRFVWESGHWVAIRQYMSSGFEAKMLTVYTDVNRDAWVFTFDKWEVLAPFGEGWNVKDIFEILNLSQ